MTPKRNTPSLALMCKTHNYKVDTYADRFRVGNWVIAETRRQELLGRTVVLTESQTSPAYLGGRIVGFTPTHKGKCEVVFQADDFLVGNTDAVGHPGWGRGRGVCYV